MTQIAPNASYLLIQDQLDAVGQKYRGQRIVRGAMLFVTCAALSTMAAALAAHWIGAGLWVKLILGAWICWLAGSAAVWILRPLLIRPDPVQVARLVEGRVQGLYNGLTNSLLLARREDIADSPFLPQIYDEVLRQTQSTSLGAAIKMRDLRSLAVGLGIATALILAIGLLFESRVAHGWQQLFSPMTFVPQVGIATIVDVQPGNAQVVLGQPLDIAVTATVPASLGQPAMRLIFGEPAGSTSAPEAVLPPDVQVLPGGAVAASDLPAGREAVRYTYHIDHLDRTVRYRVEVGGTQSPWYTATVIRQVTLQELSLTISPPSYTGQPNRSLRIKAADLGKTVVAVPQGSRVEVQGVTDLPVGGAMLQTGDNARPAPMSASMHNRVFTGAFTIVEDTPLLMLLTDNAGQILFRVPADHFVIGCTKDAPPIIQMKWPEQDVTVPLNQALTVSALVRDDAGLTMARVRMNLENSGNENSGAALPVIYEARFTGHVGVGQPVQLSVPLKIDPAWRKPGAAVKIVVEAADNRDLGSAALAVLAADRKDADATALAGPQTTISPMLRIRFADPAQISTAAKDTSDELRQRLQNMLDAQKMLLEQTRAGQMRVAQTRAAQPMASTFTAVMKDVSAGQAALREDMRQTAQTFTFKANEQLVQKTLLMLSLDPAKDAVELSGLLETEPDSAQRAKLDADLQSRQRRIILTLQSLLELLNRPADLTTQPSQPGGDLANRADAMKKLGDALKQYMKEQQRLLDQTANLAKKPVDQFDDADKKELADLAMAQEKLDAFMQEKIHDFSKLSEQDMANASLLKELMEIYSEVTMAKDALRQKATEIAVAAEENGVEAAKEISNNLEKWLANTPDRIKWTQEDPLSKQDLPMPELPRELEDMVGKLMEQEEDLFDEMEDANANWATSGDKGIGWDAADGPIANMSAKGVTGNQLPNNNEMNGRSGEGRSGKSSGEMVENTATGKGGRRTPTRLDPTAFQQGQVKDTSKDPTGGATGGGKLSGQGGQGLEGPVGPQLKQQMQRLAQKQAQLRNNAERVNLQYQLGRYDNFRLTQGIAIMRRVEADLDANRYQTAMHQRDLLLDSLSASRTLLGAEVHVKQDTTPTSSSKTRRDISDAMRGDMPPAWKESLKKYYERLGQE